MNEKETLVEKREKTLKRERERDNCKRRKVRIRSIFSKDEFFTIIFALSHKDRDYFLVWEIWMMILKFEKIFKCFTQSIFKKLMKVYKANFKYFFKERYLKE